MSTTAIYCQAIGAEARELARTDVDATLGRSARASEPPRVLHDVHICTLGPFRLGRRAGELITLIDELDQRGVGFRALNSPMDTTTPAGRAFLQIQAAFAEMERNVIRQRVREGVRAARARGRKGGRPRVMTPEKLRYAQNLMSDRTRSIPDICRELGDLPTSTLYHYLHANGALKDPGRRLLAP